jgi:FAD/FMN-containing dehydrogenase
LKNAERRLQGGLGWNARGWGWAAEQVIGIDVVTAEGLSVHCSQDVNPDLFWAARGSGPGFFAVATQFHLQTKPLPSGMLESTYVWDISEYDTIMPWVIETCRIANRNVEIIALAVYPEPTEPIANQRIQLVVHVLTFNDSVAEARTSLALFSTTVPLRAKALVAHEYNETSLAEEFLQEAKAFPEKHRYCVDNAWIHSYLPTDQVVEAMRDVFTSLPSAESNAMYFSMAPEPPISEMALSLQTEHWLCVTCAWTDSKDDAEYQSWLRSKFKDMDRVSPGVYVGDSDFQVRKAPFLAPGKREKLESIRKLWDSQGLFCSYLGLESE